MELYLIQEPNAFSPTWIVSLNSGGVSNNFWRRLNESGGGINITESGFTGSADELVKQVASSTEGFTLVLEGLKALLEHKLRLNLVADRFPKGIEEG
jgi:hypothetical protein